MSSGAGTESTLSFDKLYSTLIDTCDLKGYDNLVKSQKTKAIPMQIISIALSVFRKEDNLFSLF
jgi:hypothetical protein